MLIDYSFTQSLPANQPGLFQMTLQEIPLCRNTDLSHPQLPLQNYDILAENTGNAFLIEYSCIQSLPASQVRLPQMIS